MERRASSGPGRYAHLLWNTPLAAAHAARLLTTLQLEEAESIADVGCGWGELLLRSLEHRSAPAALRGIGVDSDAALITHAQAEAAARGLSERVDFLCVEAEGWRGESSRVLCIGAAHALGGTATALQALPGRVRRNGLLLFGDGCWEHPVTAEARGMFPEVLDLSAVVDAARVAGWRLEHLDTATQLEWDCFESGWRRGQDPAVAAARQREYADVYRGQLGFCYLILRR